MGQAQFLNESEEAIRLGHLLSLTHTFHRCSSFFSSPPFKMLVFLFRLIFLPRPLRYRHLPCPERPPWAATENTIPLCLVMAVGREIVTGFRHGAPMDDIQQHYYRVMSLTPHMLLNCFIASLILGFVKK